MTILIIDDDEFLADIYETAFRKAGFETIVARSGEEGLKAAERSRPDLVMLDVAMPRMSGHEVLAALKAGPKTKRIPVIMLTNRGEKADIDEAMARGAVGFLIKAHSDPMDAVAKAEEALKKSD